jgi:hypothetical protein
MPWTYSGNPKHSQKDRYRFLLTDTDPDEPIMSDEEIMYIVDAHTTTTISIVEVPGPGGIPIKQEQTTVNSDDLRIQYELFTRIAMIFARQIRRSLGPQSEDPTKRNEFFRSKADELKTLLAARGVKAPTHAYPKTFRKGMQSNPRWPQNAGNRNEGYLV